MFPALAGGFFTTISIWTFKYCFFFKLINTDLRGQILNDILQQRAPKCPKAFQSQVKASRSVVSNSLWPHRLYIPWDSPGQNTEVGSLSLLQEICPTQGWNLGLLHCRWILCQLSHEGSPRIPLLQQIFPTQESNQGLLHSKPTNTLKIFSSFGKKNFSTFYVWRCSCFHSDEKDISGILNWTISMS